MIPRKGGLERSVTQQTEAVDVPAHECEEAQDTGNFQVTSQQLLKTVTKASTTKAWQTDVCKEATLTTSGFKKADKNRSTERGNDSFPAAQDQPVKTTPNVHIKRSSKESIED